MQQFQQQTAMINKSRRWSLASHRPTRWRCLAIASAMCSFLCFSDIWAQEAATALVKPPEVVKRADADYPPGELAARLEATVMLLVTVGADGSVTDVSVAESGGEAFDQAAIAAVRQWKFTPARRGDTPIVSRIRIPFQFALPAVEQIPAPQPQPQIPAPPAPTQQPASAQESTTEEAIDVTVRGRPRPLSRGTSDFQIDVGALATVPRQNASEMLKLAPGILLTNEGGEAHAEQVFLRGFDAREGQDIEFTAGGVPINESGNIHGNGYADTHFIIPELVSSLRVLEGPFDPRQGNYAVAGSAEYELGLPNRGVTAKYTTGSFGTNRTLLLWGPRGASDATFAGVDLYETSGFGQNRDGHRASVMAQYEGHSGAHTYRIGATAYIASFHAAGVLRDDDYRAGRVGFFDTYDPLNGEDTSRYSITGDLISRFGSVLVRNQVFAIARPMRLRENFTGFLLDIQQPQQSPHGQRGDLIDLHMQEDTFGARGSVRISEFFLGQPQEVELGYFARGDIANGTQYRIEYATGHPYHLDTSLDSTLGNIALYGDLNLRATPWLSLRGGVRAELLTYDVNNNCAVQSVSRPNPTNPQTDQSCLSQGNMGAYREPVQRSSTIGSAILPRGSLILGPFSGFGASVGYGKGVRSIDPIYISQDAKTPFASAKAFEAGVSYSRRFRAVDFGVRSTFFETKVDQDLIFSEIAGRNILGGASTRKGVANAARATGSFFDVAANYTYVKATFDDNGLLIPYIPDNVFRFDGSLFGDIPFLTVQPMGKRFRGLLSTGITYVSPRPLPLGERGNKIFVVDLNATLSWSFIELGFICTNLFDTRYRLSEFNYASDFSPITHAEQFPTLVAVRHFTAGAPRAFYFTIGVTFGGQR
jgi:iron complex outermembrane recepter protein